MQGKKVLLVAGAMSPACEFFVEVHMKGRSVPNPRGEEALTKMRGKIGTIHYGIGLNRGGDSEAGTAAGASRRRLQLQRLDEIQESIEPWRYTWGFRNPAIPYV